MTSLLGSVIKTATSYLPSNISQPISSVYRTVLDLTGYGPSPQASGEAYMAVSNHSSQQSHWYHNQGGTGGSGWGGTTNGNTYHQNYPLQPSQKWTRPPTHDPPQPSYSPLPSLDATQITAYNSGAHIMNYAPDSRPSNNKPQKSGVGQTHLSDPWCCICPGGNGGGCNGCGSGGCDGRGSGGCDGCGGGGCSF